MKKKIIASIIVLILMISILPIYSRAANDLRNPRFFGSDTYKTIEFENGTSADYYDPYYITWDCVYFGSYWQKDSEGNIDKTKEKQPIKWRVLSVDGDDLFLLADDILSESMEYAKKSDGSWKNSIVRNWIQTDFIPNAFTEDEQNDIIETDTTLDDVQTVDRVFAISKAEVETQKYGFRSNLGDGKIWWLRCNKKSSYDTSNCAYDMYYYAIIPTWNSHGVRPALHLKKSSTNYKKAGTINSYNEIDVEPRPQILPTMIPTSTPVPTATPTPQSQTPKKVVKKVAAPSKPQKVKAQNNKKKTATIIWSKVTGAKGYQVQYAYSASAPFSKKTKTVIVNKFVAKKLKKKKTYSFRVRAYKMNGKKKLYGKWSKVVRIKIIK